MKNENKDEVKKENPQPGHQRCERGHTEVTYDVRSRVVCSALFMHLYWAVFTLFGTRGCDRAPTGISARGIALYYDLLLLLLRLRLRLQVLYRHVQQTSYLRSDSALECTAKFKVCMLLAVGVVSAQTAHEGGNPTESAVPADTAAPSALDALVADAAAQASNPAAASAATSASATATASARDNIVNSAAAAAAGGLANRGTVGLNLGPAFFGPGLNNPLGIPPNTHVVSVVNNYLKSHPNQRARVAADGSVVITDQFGREVEPVNPIVADVLEGAADIFELQERLTEGRQHALEEAIFRCETNLRQRYLADPGAFTPAILRGVNFGNGGLGGARAVLA